MSFDWCRAHDGGVRLRIQAVPNAKRSEVAGTHGDALRIRLAAQAIDGKANAELTKFLSTVLHVPRSCIDILQGQSGRSKLVQINVASLQPDQVSNLLLPVSSE